MTMQLQQQLEFIIRILLSGICGAAIGYERKNRNKEAGIRTHLIVAAGACLMMIISKYGFADILGNKGIALDPSRIAAQIVTGVGFLGAGMIFMRRNTISGLTTAAGIWATSGIGMAIGSGLYLLGVVTSVFIILIQIILHGNHRWIHESSKDEMTFVLQKDKQAVTNLKELLIGLHIELLTIKVTQEHEHYVVELNVVYPEGFQVDTLIDVFKDKEYIKEIDI